MTQAGSHFLFALLISALAGSPRPAAELRPAPAPERPKSSRPNAAALSPGPPGGSPCGCGPGAPPSRMAKASSFSMPAISLSCCAKKAAAGSSSPAPATPFPSAGPPGAPAGAPNGSSSAMTAQLDRSDTKAEANRPQADTASGSGHCWQQLPQDEREEGEGESGSPASISGWVGEPLKEQPIRGQELPNQLAKRRSPGDNS